MFYKFCLTLFVLLLILSGCGNNGEENLYTGILEGTSVRVPALTGGQIENLFVNTGELVQKGQVIARIDSLELIYQRQQLTAMLQELKVQSEIAQTDLERTVKDLNYVETKYRRIDELYKTESASKQNRDDVENQLNNLKAVHLAAKQKLQSIAAKRNQIQAQINSINKKIGDTAISSPISGIVTNKYFEAGEAIPTLSPIVEVLDIDKLETKIYISESLLPQVKYGKPVTIRIDGLKKEVPGKVIWVSPKAEFTPKTILTPETRTSLVYAVKISLDNVDGLLKDGMPVVVELDVDSSD